MNVSKDDAKSVRFGASCAYNTHSCGGINHYDHECAVGDYDSRLESLMAQYDLPPSMKSNSHQLMDKGAFDRECPSFSLSASSPRSEEQDEGKDGKTKDKGPYMLQVNGKDAMPVKMTSIDATDISAAIPTTRSHFFASELKNFKRASMSAKLNNFEIAGFYHATRYDQRWREVFEEQLTIADGLQTYDNFNSNANSQGNRRKQLVSLLLESSQLFVNVVGQSKDDYNAYAQVCCVVVCAKSFCCNASCSLYSGII